MGEGRRRDLVFWETLRVISGRESAKEHPSPHPPLALLYQQFIALYRIWVTRAGMIHDRGVVGSEHAF